MLRRLYDWTMGLAARRQALTWLGVVSFLESSFFPIPPDVMLVPMVLAQRERWIRIATVCTVTSVVGGFFGYAIGLFLFESVGLLILKAYGLASRFEELRVLFDQWGAWIILIKGLTPIPYKLITIAAGLFKFDLATFAICSIVTRGARFFLVAGLLYWIGEPIREFIERRLTLVTTLFVVGLVGGFVVVKWLI
jgi:membrane protein YqaA with SNARE-associated domain